MLEILREMLRNELTYVFQHILQTSLCLKKKYATLLLYSFIDLEDVNKIYFSKALGHIKTR